MRQVFGAPITLLFAIAFSLFSEHSGHICQNISSHESSVSDEVSIGEAPEAPRALPLSQHIRHRHHEHLDASHESMCPPTNHDNLFWFFATSGLKTFIIVIDVFYRVEDTRHLFDNSTSQPQ